MIKPKKISSVIAPGAMVFGCNFSFLAVFSPVIIWRFAGNDVNLWLKLNQ